MPVTVLARATATVLTTPANVRGDLGLPEEAWSDTKLTRLIAQASATAASFCRRSFGRETIRERFDLGCLSRDALPGGLLLDRAPVVSVAYVALDGAILDPGVYEAEDRTLYRVQDGERRSWCGRTLVVEYVAGWFLPSEDDEAPEGVEPLPADIERAVIQLVGVAVSAAGRDAMVKQESVDGVGSQSFYVQGSTASLPHPEAEAALSQYRRVFLG